MAEIARRDGPSDPDFRRSFVDATYTWTQDLVDAGAAPPAVDAALELARDAARRFAGDEGRLRVEALAASAHAAHGALDEARRVLEAGLAGNPLAVRTRPQVQLALADVLQRTGESDAALAVLDALARDADVAASAADPVLRDDARRIRFDCELQRGAIWLLLGVPDLAAIALERCESLHAREPIDQDAADLERLQLRLLAAQLAFTAMDWTRAREILEEPIVAAAAELDPSADSLVRALRAQVASELARDALGAQDAALELLASALASAGLDELARIQLETIAGELALHGRDLDRARDAARGARARLGALAASKRTSLAIVRAGVAALEGEIALASRASPAELDEARVVLSSALDALAESWRGTPVRRGGLGFLYWGDRRAALATLVRLEMALDPTSRGLERALDHVLAFQALGTASRQAGAPAIDVGTARSLLLAPRRGVLVVLPSIERTHVFALDRDGIAHAEAPRRDEIVRRFGDLMAEVVRAPDADVERESRRARRIEALAVALGDDLVTGDVAARLRSWSEVIVSGSELCGDALFEVLRPAGGAPLGTTHAIAHAPSLPFLAHLARGTAHDAAGVELVLVASPVLEVSAQRASATLASEEADELLAPFARERTLKKLGAEAAPGVLAAPSVRDARVLAFVTHGVFDAARHRDGERPAGLALSADATSSDGVLWCADVERTRVPRLVELFSCGGERGPARMGDDAGGHLTAAFFAAGARAVVSSPADLRLGSTLELAAHVHERLRAGDAPAEALRSARARLLLDPRTSDPRSWALVRVHGLAHEAVFEPSSEPREDEGAPSTRWRVGALVAVGLVAVWLAARKSRSVEGRDVES